MMKRPRTDNGTIIEPWENDFLCSNPRVDKKVDSPVDDKDGKKPAQVDEPGGYQSVEVDAPLTSKPALGWLPLNPGDPDDIAR